MASRFVDAGSVEDFMLRKNQRDVKLLQLFLVHKSEKRNIEDIPTGELNEYLSDFFRRIK